MVILSIVMCSFLMFVGCLSTSSTFGNEVASSNPEVLIHEDKFTGNKTYEPKKGFELLYSGKGLSVDYLELKPFFIVDNETKLCTIDFKIIYSGKNSSWLVTGADLDYKKFIFLANGDKIEIEIKNAGTLEREDEYLNGSKSSEYVRQYSINMPKNKYDTVKNFFYEKNLVECAAYSLNNKVVTFSTKTKQDVFSNLENFVNNENPNIIYIK